MKWLLYVIIFLAIVNFILNLPWTFYVDRFPTEHVYSYDELESSMQTGDIILFTCTKFPNLREYLTYNLRTTAIKEEWGHISLVYRDEKTNKPYLLQFININNTGTFRNHPKKFCTMLEMQSHLEDYHENNRAYFGYRRIKVPIDNKRMLNFYQRNAHKKFRNWLLILWLFFTENDIRLDPNESFCSEFISDLLIEEGLVSSRNKAHLLFPHTFSGQKDDQLFDQDEVYEPLVYFQM